MSEWLAEVQKRPDRLRPKDSGDIALLMMVTDGAEVADTMLRHVSERPEICTVVLDGARFLVDLYGANNDTIVRGHMASSLSARFPESAIFDAVDSWLTSFSTRLAGSED